MTGVLRQKIKSIDLVIDVFDTDIATAINDFVILTASNFVSTISDNGNATIPHGVFGIVFGKPTTTTAQVLFLGRKGGFSGFTPGAALFLSTSGTPTHTKPPTGTVQQIGFATKTDELFMQIKQPMRQAT